MNIFRNFLSFPYIWCVLSLFVMATIFALFGFWEIARLLGGVSVILIIILMLFKPMNAVYGLMGASGNIKTFFWLFLCITCIFAGIYQMGFFHHAGITYDVNQPHIDYDLYTCQERKPITINKPNHRDTILYEKMVDSVLVREYVVKISHESLSYQPISIWFTLRNTIMTSLMQQPTDFFAVASIHNEGLSPCKKELMGTELDRQKSEAFQIVLTIQVLISWIFFGVFISLLYNKFRYES